MTPRPHRHDGTGATQGILVGDSNHRPFLFQYLLEATSSRIVFLFAAARLRHGDDTQHHLETLLRVELFVAVEFVSQTLSVQAMVKRFLKPAPSAIKTTPANPPVRRPRVQHTPVVTPSPRRKPPPGSPLTGLVFHEETPAERIQRIWDEAGVLHSPGSNRGASPQWALESPPSVRRQSPAQLPRTPILYEPFRSSGVSYGPHRVSAPPPDHPFVVGPSRQTPQPIRPLPDPTFDYPVVGEEAYNLQEANKGVQRRKRKRVPSEVRQHVKRLSQTPIARGTRQAVQKKAKEAATSKGTKLLKSWLKFK